ncbi:MAG TPA: protein phosphatase 2C domain-containing protein [Ktedonobacteraceae bacterium]|nr:protein phosphatase 2C domain-containing protein [Ktedonobacteraceae bacterium]
MLCPSCHTLNRDNAKFCKGCGQLLAVEIVAAAQTTQPVETLQGAMPSQTQPSDAYGSAQPTGAGQQFLDPNDPSLAPTEILTPEQMADFQARRWQRDAEFEQAQKGPWDQAHPSEQVNHSGVPKVSDIANAPTISMAPAPLPAAYAPQTSESQQDIADMPTIMVSPESAPTIYASVQQPVSSPPSASNAVVEEGTIATEHAETAQTKTAEESDAASLDPDQTQSPEQAQIDSLAVAEENPGTAEIPIIPTEEKNVDEVTNTTPDQDVSAFPVLAIGTLVNERYEILQVAKDAQEEHIYEVADRKGYLHCWNCSYEENAEGDEFCNDCGAELLNASYLMHEYPVSSAKDAETGVLQGSIANIFVDQGHTYVIEAPQTLQSAFPNGAHLLAAGDSDAGMERRDSPNEDSTLVLLLERVHESLSLPAGIFIVCDGLGGHDSGQEASRMAAKIIAERIIHELLLPPLSTEKPEDAAKLQDEENLLGLLQRAIEEANTTICQRNQREKSDMGCTLTGSMIVGDHAYIFNVGDSRTYMLRDGKLYQLTNDHSLVGQLVAGGLIAPDDVYTHPQRSQIYRNIGDKLNVQIDVFKQQIHPGDVLLSCSDGLWEMIRDPQITDILNATPDPQTACTQLIETANTNGGEDNVSAVVVFVR